MRSDDKAVKAVTIKEVAKLAGVSISTVSRVINDKSGVTPDTQARIEQAISQLNYRSNSIARALRINSTKTIGFIVPSVENPTFGILAKAIESTANEYGFSTILCNSEGQIEKEVHYLRLLLEQQVDGILFNALGLYDERFSKILGSDTPIIVIGRKVPGFPTANITTDNREGARRAVSYLINSGLKHIAFIYGQFESVTAIEDRFNGYRNALVENGIPFRQELVMDTEPSFDSGAKAVQKLLDSNIQFDGIFASNDLIALSCIQQLDLRGLRIPTDVSVMGYDRIPFSQMRYPKLSTVDSKLTVLGQEAVKAIIELIRSKSGSRSEIIIQPSLVLGGTTL